MPVSTADAANTLRRSNCFVHSVMNGWNSTIRMPLIDNTAPYALGPKPWPTIQPDRVVVSWKITSPWSNAQPQNHMKLRSRSTGVMPPDARCLRVGSGCDSGTRTRMITAKTAEVAASPRNSARYETVATAPAAIGAIEKPMLIAQ